MESEKQFKDDSNSHLKSGETAEEIPSNENSALEKFEKQFNFSPQTQTLIKRKVSEQAVEDIKHIFEKTQTIRKVADEKHQEIQAQFKELRERLNSSSECLQRMKKGIDNIKFSYSTKILEMHQTLRHPEDYYDATKQPAQTKEEVAKQMEEIRDKIEKIQNNVYTEKEKQEKVMQSYKDAFENVSDILKNLDSGDYTSIKLHKIKKDE